MSHECGHCEHAVDTIRDELVGMSDVELRAVDVAEEPEVAARAGVRCCPSVLIDGAVAFLGVPSRASLARAVEAAAAGRPLGARASRRYEGAEFDVAFEE